MKLHELFKDPSEWGDNEAKLADAPDNESTHKRFKTPKGKHVDMSFYKLAKPNLYYVAFQVDEEIGVTGGGEEYKIFSTIIAILQEFLNNTPDAIIKFSAIPQNREDLYDRMLKRLLKSEYKIVKPSPGDYLISKRN